jgi:hypothetical protein
MQKVVWTEKQVEGGKLLNIKLEEPNSNNNYYRDIAVLAFPTPRSEYEGKKAFRIAGWKEKAGFKRPQKAIEPDSRKVDDADIILKDKIIVLTSKMDASGQLNWQMPEGKWTIIRFGYTPTGEKNRPSPPGGEGLECDKLSKAAAELHWENSVQKIIDDAGPNAKKTFNNVLIDSYEVKCQNWTHNFPAEFKKRMGYALTPYLPVLTGRVVGSLEISERFLWDFRRVISDLFTENYYGHFSEMCHRNGLTLSIEPYGNGNFDEFTAASKADIPMGEWWMTDVVRWCDYTGKLASSSAHTYGHKYVGAEAFTARWPDAAFINHPFRLKSQGDYFYCQGVNRFIFHTYAHQPWMNVQPVMTLARYGTQFNRGNTWFEKSSGWVDYLTRCQYLLQEGRFVADLCYLGSEESPNKMNRRPDMLPMPPSGYDYDFCTTENLMQMKVKDGIILLPSGMSYRILVLPSGNMRPDVLKQINKLVTAGAIVYGGRPEKSPSLQNYPICDNEIKKLTDELWNSGKIISAQPLEQVLQSKGILPDFESSGGISNAPTLYSATGVEYIHRKIDDADVYFVSNQRQESQNIEAIFRINHKIPELWNPDTGKIEEASSYSFTKDGRMAVSLSFDQSGSAFVVFRKQVSAEKQADKTPEVTSSEITGSWTLRFPKGWGTPEEIKIEKLSDWTQFENYDIKHFSGTATYLKDFEFSAATGKTVFLDLGTVNVIAEVKLNGKNLGILWKPPFRVEITDAIKTGSNHLEIEITNLWVNRLIGDEKYPDDCKWQENLEKGKFSGWQIVEIPQWVKDGKPRPSIERKTFVTWKWYKAGDPLLPSGLLGPVRVIKVKN